MAELISLHERCQDGAEFSVSTSTIQECETKIAEWRTRHNEHCLILRNIAERDKREAANTQRQADRTARNTRVSNRQLRDAPGMRAREGS